MTDAAAARPTIIVFAKAPEPGRVKTRLGLDPETAASLYEAFVNDTLEMALELRDAADIELHTDIETTAWRGYDIPRARQAQGNLGTRMLAALRSKGGAGPVMILGSDAPSLPGFCVRGLLEMRGDVVLGPTQDGGYWAILARRTDDRMFAGVEWSTALTRRQTVDAVKACGLSVSLGDPWFDVDELSDLRRLAVSNAIRRHTEHFLQRHPGLLHLQ